MSFALKLVLANLVIVSAALVGRRHPALGGLIATMPLTSLVVLFWLHTDDTADLGRMAAYGRGAMWGILPSLLFFVALSVALDRGLSLWPALAIAGCVWLAGAAVHQLLLR
jgi:F0F1-type ATP synthase assembly protein I